MSQESRCVKIEGSKEGGMDKPRGGSFIWRAFETSEAEEKRLKKGEF